MAALLDLATTAILTLGSGHIVGSIPSWVLDVLHDVWLVRDLREWPT